MLPTLYEFRYPLAVAAGVCAGSLSFLVWGARLTTPPPEPPHVQLDVTQTPYFRGLVEDNAQYRLTNFKLRCRLADAETERDSLRRQQMARPITPGEPNDLPPGDRIPPQAVPTEAK